MNRQVLRPWLQTWTTGKFPMKLPFFWLAAGLSLGILAAPFLSAVIPLPMVLLILLSGFPILLAARRTCAFLPLFIFLIAAAGMGLWQIERSRPSNAVENFICDADGKKSDGVSEACFGRAVLEGVVASMPESKKTGRKENLSFIVEAQSLFSRRGGEISVKKVSGKVQIFIFQPPVIPSSGERVRIWGSLERPKPALNFGQFDYASYLAQNGICAVFQGYGPRAIQIRGASRMSWFSRAVTGLQAEIARRIDTLFKGDDAILFKALMLGTRKGLSPDLKDDFIKTGTSHLIAISGLNISLVAGSVYLLLLFCGLGQKVSAISAFLICLLQVWVAGLGIPVQRAGWMSGAAFLSLIFEREYRSLNIFFLAYCMLVFFSPSSLYQVSFQLSFLSVLSLILFLRPLDAWVRGWDGLTGSVAVLAGTFPFVLYHFNIFSPVSIVANLGAIPLFHLAQLGVLAVLMIYPLPILTPAAAAFSDFFLRAALGWIHFCSLPRWGYHFVLTPSIPKLCLYYALLFGFFLASQKQFKWKRPLLGLLASGWILCAVTFFTPSAGSGMKVYVFAAGKNDIVSVHFDSRNHWLINSGRGRPSDQAEWIVNPYFKKNGIKEIDGLILTDYAQRHIGGVPAFLKDFSVESFFLPLSGNPAPLKLPRRAKSSLIREGGKIIPAPGSEILFLGAETSPPVLLSGRGKKFLYLPGLDEQTLSSLRLYREQILGADILILPPRVEAGFLDRLFDLVAPSAVTAPGASAELESALRERDIQLIDLMVYGGVEFLVSGGPSDSILTADSFLRGRIPI